MGCGELLESSEPVHSHGWVRTFADWLCQSSQRRVVYNDEKVICQVVFLFIASKVIFRKNTTQVHSWNNSGETEEVLDLPPPLVPEAAEWSARLSLEVKSAARTGTQPLPFSLSITTINMDLHIMHLVLKEIVYKPENQAVLCAKLANISDSWIFTGNGNFAFTAKNPNSFNHT